jgi:peptide/nickel transport system substrate-binding protein
MRRTALLFSMIVLIALGTFAAAQRANIVVASLTDVSTLDPYGMFSRHPEMSLLDHVAEALTFRNAAMEIEPNLAESWQRLEDGTTWEFTLRRGVTFSNGEPFDAAAVKANLDFLTARFAAGQPLGVANVAAPGAQISGVRVVDDVTVAIETVQPKSTLAFLADLASMPMLAPAWLSASTDASRSTEIVGTGRYVIAERVRDSHTVLRLRPDYWGEPGKTEEIVFRVIPEAATQIAELETGGVDIITNVPLDQARIIDAAPGARAITIQGGRRVFPGITTDGTYPPLADARVRRAMNHAFDFEAVNEGLFQGRGTRMSYSFNAPFSNTDLEPYAYDPDLARQLLAEAGYPDGFELDEFATTRGRWIQDYELALAIAADLEEIGITFRDGVVPYEWGVYREKLLGFDLPAVFMQSAGGAFEAGPEAANYVAGGGSNFYRWVDPRYQELFQQLGGALDFEERYALAQEMQKLIRDEAPHIFVYFQLDTYGVSDRIDWQPHRAELVHLWNVEIVRP